MAYPLIILGAGASYDYSPSGGLGRIAPLTKDLAEDKFFHPGFLDRYRGAGNLLLEMIYQVRSNKRGFEEALTEFLKKSKNSIEMQRRFVSLEFYLRDLFKEISSPNDTTRKFHQVNNYQGLLNRMDTYANRQGIVATFNYDSLFENELGLQQPERMIDYISNDLKIIKLHGSHDWAYINRQSKTVSDELRNKTSYEKCIANPEFFNQIKNGKNEESPPIHEKEFNINSERKHFCLFPALAIPLIGKHKYICPERHIRELEQNLKKVDRILIIGWRAEDPALLETLKRYLPPEMSYKVLVVSGTLEGAKKIAKKVQQGLGIVNEFYIQARGDGFSGFIRDEASHAFFNS